MLLFQPPHEPSPPAPSLPRDAELIFVSFPKVRGSMGLSIVAAKGAGQSEKGIYIKSLVPAGAAALDGRLEVGYSTGWIVRCPLYNQDFIIIT